MDRSHAIRAIKDAADLVGLIQERVKLRKSGAGWMGGPCPIHGGGSRTPCISVQPEKGQWHCFSCGEGGDAFDWMQKVHGLTFEEAVEDLAKRTGILLPEYAEKSPDSPESKILGALSSAQDFYASQLQATPTALDYLRGRGLSAALVEAEGIGYAPAGWDVTLTHLQSGGVRADVAEAAGLAIRSQRGTMIDFFRDRITVPIRDARGRVIAFGARVMPGAPPESPKYMNSRETPLFHKGEVVFGLHRARAYLRESGAMICEGYFDVFSLWDHGITTAVAPMGTALTDAHLAQLKKWTSRITLAFDGDAAGISAMEKALEKALPAGFEVRLLSLPTGEDPDTWVQSTPGAKDLILKAPDWATFRLAKAKAGRDFRRLEDRMAAAREVAEWIAYLPQERQKEIQITAAHELKVPPEQLEPKPQAPKERPKPQPSAAPKMPADEAVQALMVMAAKGGPHLAWVQNIPQGWWDRRPGSNTLETLLDVDGEVEALGPDAQAAIRAAEIQEATRAQIDPRRLHARLEREFLSREIQELTRSLAINATDQTLASQLQVNLIDLRTRLARLMKGRP